MLRLLVPTAVVMLIVPSLGYDTFHGVPNSGPMNYHLLRDLSCALLVVGTALLYPVLRPSNVCALCDRARGPALAEAPGDTTLHVVDIATVYLPAGLALLSVIMWARKHALR